MTTPELDRLARLHIGHAESIKDRVRGPVYMLPRDHFATAKALKEAAATIARLEKENAKLRDSSHEVRQAALREAAEACRSIIDGRIYFNERARKEDEEFFNAILALTVKK